MLKHCFKKDYIFILILFVFISFICMADKNSVAADNNNKLIPAFSVQAPIIYQNLAIFPVKLQEGSKKLNLLTLDEAMKREYLVIKEVQDGQVNTVELENISDSWIFLLSGEIIAGAKQNRMIGKDTLIPPKSGKIKEQVFCVEHGRWVHESEKFGSNEVNCNMDVRQAAKQTNDQGTVWNKVSENTKISGKANPTGKFDVIYEDKEIQKKIDEYMKTFSNLTKENKDMTGVAVVIGSEITGVDIFGDRDLFEKLWPKLLKSYITDALTREKIEKPAIKDKDIEKFLNKAKEAKIEKDTSSVAGTRLDFSSKEVVGGIILDKNENIVHYVQFPYKEEINKENVNNQNQINVQQQINAPVNNNDIIDNQK